MMHEYMKICLTVLKSGNLDAKLCVQAWCPYNDSNVFRIIALHTFFIGFGNCDMD
jgi:hypothetical protein